MCIHMCMYMIWQNPGFGKNEEFCTEIKRNGGTCLEKRTSLEDNMTFIPSLHCILLIPYTCKTQTATNLNNVTGTFSCIFLHKC